MKEKILCIIPARANSKRLPKKNIIDLCGKPLIYYSIKAAKESKYISRFVVSTDSMEIGQIATDFGADVIIRPDYLATDTATSFDVVKHVLDHLNGNFDLVLLLEPTSPLRAPKDIDNAIQLFLSEYAKGNNPEAVVSVGKIALENPYISKVINRDGFIEPLIKGKEQKIAYFPYGVIYLVKVKAFLDQKTFYPKRTLPYFIERWQNYEVDDIYDLKCVEAVMKFMALDR